MKKTGYSIFLILVSITSFACLRKEITNAQQNNVANIESNNKSTKNTIEKVENLEGIFIRNNPMAQWNISNLTNKYME